jgi:hypothetical protein
LDKSTLAAELGISRSTLDEYLRRKPGFPVVRRGGHGVAWQFDVPAVRTFLAGLATASPSLDDQIKRARLQAMQVANRRKAELLVSAEGVGACMAALLGALQTEMRGFVDRHAIEQGWPAAVREDAQQRAAAIIEGKAAAAVAALPGVAVEWEALVEVAALAAPAK